MSLRPSKRLAILTGPAVFGTILAAVSHAAAADDLLYWCPDRPADRQYTARPAPGCIPLAGEARSETGSSEGPGGAERVDLVNLPGSVSRFLERYNRFIDCCATEPQRLDEVDALRVDASALLLAVQHGMAGEALKLRGFTFRELINPVAQARRNLTALTERLKALSRLESQLPLLDYETAGRVKRKIAEGRDAIRRTLEPLRLPRSARTGSDIQDTSLPTRVGSGDDGIRPMAGTRTPGTQPGEPQSLRPRTGAALGGDATVGSDIGRSPATGFGIGGISGPTGQSSLPTRSGPDIGDSDLNR